MYREAIESSPTAKVMIESSGRIVMVNRETERLFGYTREELLKENVEVLVPERFRDAHPQHRDSFLRSPSERRMGAGRDLFGRRKDGSEFPIELGLKPVHVNGRTYVLSAIVDITERKRLEQGLRESREALEQSNMELKQFAYIASHDLQTPLRTIAGFAQLLSDDFAEKLDDDARAYIGRIVSGCTRMQTLIDDLLAYSRVESRTRPFERVDMDEVLRDVASMLEADLAEVAGELRRQPLPVVQGDRSQLTQLLMNLIGNGLKYHGEVPPVINVSAEQADGHWVFAVRDNGIGIAEQHHDKIFEIFRRLHTQHKYPGTGIGLAVCRRIVERHGGKIWAASKPGEGATFSFTLNPYLDD
ncbi:MAG: PAS domain S-box protein [Planctomycetales bacterium]|nr:PAS domain S-box protein [Planctomycetales bacterium]